MEDLDPREEQLQSIKDGLNVFACLPTGFGKKIFCYQAISFVMDFKLGRAGTSSILVVSPLVSLMVDQVVEKEETEDFNHHFCLAKPHLAGETSLCQTTCCSVNLKLSLWLLLHM